MADNTSNDPFVEAVASHISEVAKHHLTEGHPNLNEFMKATAEEARGYDPGDVAQLAQSLLWSSGKRIKERGNARAGEKLMAIATQIDRILDTY